VIVSQPVEHQKTDVVPGKFILRANVSQAGDEVVHFK